VNLEAELEVMALHARFDEVQTRQFEAIARIEELLAERAGS
jgi:uncharacterized membrane protein